MSAAASSKSGHKSERHRNEMKAVGGANKIGNVVSKRNKSKCLLEYSKWRRVRLCLTASFPTQFLSSPTDWTILSADEWPRLVHKPQIFPSQQRRSELLTMFIFKGLFNPPPFCLPCLSNSGFSLLIALALGVDTLPSGTDVVKRLWAFQNNSPRTASAFDNANIRQQRRILCNIQLGDGSGGGGEEELEWVPI